MRKILHIGCLSCVLLLNHAIFADTSHSDDRQTSISASNDLIFIEDDGNTPLPKKKARKLTAVTQQNNAPALPQDADKSAPQVPGTLINPKTPSAVKPATSNVIPPQINTQPKQQSPVTPGRSQPSEQTPHPAAPTHTSNQTPTSQTATQPTIQPLVAQPAAQPLTTQPTAQPLATQPAAQPLTTQPTAQPLATQPAAQPLTTQSTAQPLVAQPAAQPLTTQPTAQPLVTQPTAQPLATQPTAQPLATQPAAQPLTTQPTAQPLVTQPTAQPLATQPTAQPLATQPTAQPLVAQPAAQPLAAQPATQSVAVQPTVQSVAAPSVPIQQSTLSIDCSYRLSNSVVVSDNELTLWSQYAALKSFEYSFDKLDEQLNNLRHCFTDQGWHGFNDALEQSGNLSVIKKQQLKVSSQLSGNPVIKKTKDNEWTVQLPLAVVYQNTQEKFTQSLAVTLVITKKTSNELGIMQLIATVQPETGTTN